MTTTIDSRLRTFSWLFSSWMLVVLVGGVYCSALFTAYVFDDVTVFQNEDFLDVSTLKWWSWKERPVTRTTFAIQIATIGPSSFASHLISVLIHLAAVVGLRCTSYKVIRLARPDMTDVRLDSLSFVVGLLWGVHPITTAAVTYAVQRYESLAACFIIWSCFYWIQAVHANAAGASRARSRWWSWGLSMLFALLAMGSKETAAGLPLILILYSLLASKSMKSDWRLFIGPLLLLMIVIVAGYLRAPYLLKPNNRVGTIGFGLVGIDAVEYISTQPLIYLRYLKLLVWPSDLVLDYGWIPSLFNRWIVVGQLIWLGIIVVMGVLVRWQPVAAWLLSSCLLILSVTSFIPTQDMIFEHRFYLPSALLIGLVVFTADRYLPERLTIARLLGFTAIAIALSYATIARNFDYTSAAELATKDLERVPNNPRNYARWGAEVADERNPMMLEETLETAIEMAKERGYFHSGLNFAWRLRLADLLYLRGEIVEARRWYEEALEESHSELQTVQVLMPLAIIASMEGRDEEAERLFEEALEVDTPMREQVELSYRTHLSRKSSGVGLAPTPKS